MQSVLFCLTLHKSIDYFKIKKHHLTYLYRPSSINRKCLPLNLTVALNPIIGGVERWSWSPSKTGRTRYIAVPRELPWLLDLYRLFCFELISDGWLGLYISFGRYWAKALECWRSPSLRLVIPDITVSPGVTHFDSRIFFVTGAIVKHQPPTIQSSWLKKAENEINLRYQLCPRAFKRASLFL